MKIDIDNLKISIDKLNNLLIDYEKIYKNFYHEMVNVKSYWHDNHANAFFERIQKEKKENIIFYKEFKAICDLYKYIFNKYQNIGKKIEFELDNRDILLGKIDDYINIIDDVINKYKHLDCNFALDESRYFIAERKEYAKIKNNLLEIRENNKNIIDDIASIEKQVKLKISKISIRTITDNGIKNFSLGNDEDVYFDFDNVDISIKKLNFYIRDESINFEEISGLFDVINYDYNTDNRDDFTNLLEMFIHKYKIIINNHKNSLSLININREVYTNVDNMVSWE